MRALDGSGLERLGDVVVIDGQGLLQGVGIQCIAVFEVVEEIHEGLPDDLMIPEMRVRRMCQSVPMLRREGTDRERLQIGDPESLRDIPVIEGYPRFVITRHGIPRFQSVYHSSSSWPSVVVSSSNAWRGRTKP